MELAECRGELAEVAERCPATFDGTREHLPACSPRGVQQVWTCEGKIALNLTPASSSTDCYYDPTTHMLLGAMMVNDTSTLCSGTSFTKTAGEVPVSPCRYPGINVTIYRVCTDTDGGTSG